MDTNSSRLDVLRELSAVANAVPAIPATDGEAAWVVARIEQLRDRYREQFGATLTEVGVLAPPALLATLTSQQDQLVVDGIDIMLGDAPDPEGDDVYLLMVELADNPYASAGLRPAAGIALPQPCDPSHLELRWTLQEIDRMPADQARAAADRL